MKKEIILLLIVVIGTCFLCGCLNQSQSVQQISDDDLYMKTLDDFITTSNQQQQTTAQFNQEQMGAAELKIRSTTYYNRVLSLKVSSKFEFSRTSFLQSLKETEAIADFMLSHSSEERMKFALVPSSFTAAQKQEYIDAVQHNQNFGLFFIKTFDSNICSAENEKYVNITRMCKSVQSMTK
jgi:outer membrane murein-binding lipoprotein Lpp